MEEVLSLMRFAGERKLEVTEIQLPQSAIKDLSFKASYTENPSRLMGYAFRFADRAALICK